MSGAEPRAPVGAFPQLGDQLFDIVSVVKVGKDRRVRFSGLADLDFDGAAFLQERVGDLAVRRDFVNELTGGVLHVAADGGSGKVPS